MNTIATFSRLRQKLGLFLSVVMSMALLFTLLATSDIGRAQAQTTADSCVVPVSGDGTITGSWSSDCASEGRSGSYARFYTFTLGEPRDVAITLESQVNTYLYAREGEGTDGRIVYEDNDDDNSVFSLASSTDSGISESLGAGVYTIEATTVTPGEMGEFTLTIRGVTGAYDALFNRYDTDGDGQINKPEVIAAVRDYLGGQITKAQVVEVIRHYIIGPPTPTPEPTPDPTPTPSPTPPASDKVYTLRELAELEDEWEFSDPDIRIRVQAYVYFVEDDVGDLTLWIRDAGYSEYCYFDEAHRTAVTALSEGEQVTVDGTFNGTWLRDCVLVTGSTSEPAPPPAPEPSVTETPSPTTYRSLVITDEDRCSDYDADDYSYPQSVEADIVAGMGGIIYSPYTGEYFDSTGETDIEHIVARSEAHDSGLCDADAETRDTFASGLLNLTLAHPDLNRQEKVAKDAAEWLPEINKCWFAYRVVQVRAKYSLTVDQAEADALDAVLSECSSFEMVVVDPEAEQPTPIPTVAETTPTPEGTPEATPVATATPEIDALALYDDNGNGKISCAEARAHGIAPVHSDHPAYPYMNDADGDGVVCE